MTASFCVLVVAKAPVPGFAKTRLCPPATPAQAAEIAAASLLDTLDAATGIAGAVTVVAMTGDLAAAARSAEIALLTALVLAQGFPTTLVSLAVTFFIIAILAYVLGARGVAGMSAGIGPVPSDHADTAARYPGLPVLQIGMDTPQVTTGSLIAAIAPVLDGRDAALGRAEDGGWWALGLADPRHARVLTRVPMSRDDTGERTHRALTGLGMRPARLAKLSDVDTMADARRVAAARPDGRFAEAVAVVAG